MLQAVIEQRINAAIDVPALTPAIRAAVPTTKPEDLTL